MSREFQLPGEYVNAAGNRQYQAGEAFLNEAEGSGAITGQCALAFSNSGACLSVTITGTCALTLTPTASISGGAATAFYSLSRNRYGNTGPVVKLRENNANTLQDFKLNGSNVLVTDDGNEDTVAEWLTATGASSAFIRRLYDHSPNDNHTPEQTTDSAQPLLVLNASNGKAAAQFDGTNDWLDLSNSLFSLHDATAVVSVQPGDTANRWAVGSSGAGARFDMGVNNGNLTVRIGNVSGTVMEMFPPTAGQDYVLMGRSTSGTDNTSARTNMGSEKTGTNTQTGNVPALNLGSLNDGSSAFWLGYIFEVAIYDACLNDTERDTEERLFADWMNIPLLLKETIDNTGTGCDGVDAADFDGDDLVDAVVTLEVRKVYFFHQDPAGTYTRYDIDAVGNGASSKVEGVALADVDGNGRLPFIVDQLLGEISVYKPDSGRDFTGTWTRSSIKTGRSNLQAIWAVDLDGDGEDELVYTWEGTSNGQGGVNWLKFTGSDVTNSAHYTDNVMVQHNGAWGLNYQMLDLAGAGVRDFLFTARAETNGRNSAGVGGVYWLERPATITNAWTKHTIDATDADFLHVDTGNFFGNDHDIIVNESNGDVSLYDSSGGYGSPITPDVLSFGEELAEFNVRNTGLQSGGRDVWISSGNEWVSLRRWGGSSWVEVTRQPTAKQDGKIVQAQLTSDAFSDLLATDSNDGKTNIYSLFNVTALAQITGECALAVSGTGALTGSGALAGTCALTITPTGTLTGSVNVTGSCALTITPTGTLIALDGSITGLCGLTITPTGALTGSGALTGTAALMLVLTGNVSAETSIVGGCTLAFALSGILTDAFPPASLCICDLTFRPVLDIDDLAMTPVLAIDDLEFEPPCEC